MKAHKKRNIIGIVTVINVAIILLLSFFVYQKLNQNSFVTVLNKKSFQVYPTATLKNYFEFPNRYKNEPPSLIPSWLGYNPKYSFNADNLNELTDYPLIKPENTYRIVAIGDSITFGLYVDTKDNFTELFEKYLNTQFNCPPYTRFEVINIGLPGHDIEYVVERFKRAGKKYNPDLVIWHLQGASFMKVQDLISEKLKNYPENNDPIISEQNAANAHDEVVKELGLNTIIDRQFNSLSSISSLYTGDVLLFATAQQVEDSIKKRLEDFVKARPNTYFHILPLELGKGDFRLPDKHPNKKGHKTIATELFSYFIKSSILTCNK